MSGDGNGMMAVVVVKMPMGPLPKRMIWCGPCQCDDYYDHIFTD